MKYYVAFIGALIFFSCNILESKKKYKIEVKTSEFSISGGTEDKIDVKEKKYSSDSDAYMEGLISFYAVIKTNHLLKEKGVQYYIPKPISFCVYDEKGNNIKYNLSQETITRLENHIKEIVNKSK